MYPYGLYGCVLDLCVLFCFHACWGLLQGHHCKWQTVLSWYYLFKKRKKMLEIGAPAIITYYLHRSQMALVRVEMAFYFHFPLWVCLLLCPQSLLKQHLRLTRALLLFFNALSSLVIFELKISRNSPKFLLEKRAWFPEGACPVGQPRPPPTARAEPHIGARRRPRPTRHSPSSWTNTRCSERT